MQLVADRDLTPRDPVAVLINAAKRTSAPQVSETDGSILIADVSGFTALTASLQARHGGRGADMLSVIMDRLIGALRDIAEAHGGRVVDVIGDAIIVLWLVGDGSTPLTAQHAAQKAASAMLAHGAATSGGEHDTPIRIGIASGPIELAVVGGVGDRWELLALGQALRTAAAACAAAPKSACLIASRGAVGDPPAGAEISPNGWIVRADGVSATGAIPETIDVVAWDAELRLVTVMFCALVRADDMALVGVERVHELTRAVQDIVHRHGGMTDRVHADDKGISLVAAFGMQRGSIPGIRMDLIQGGGSPMHCMLAAIDIKAALAGLDAGCAIGIATGKVRVGVGDPANGSGYTMYGNAMNLAARCMQAAQDEILCDAATCAEVSDDVALTDAGVRTLKGLDKAGKLYAVTGIRHDRTGRGAGDTGVFAGRERERALIAAFLGDDSTDAPKVMVLEGEHGSGKSSLSAFASEDAARRGFETLTCRAAVLGTSVPLFAWRDPLAEMLNQRATARGVSAQAALTDLIVQAGGPDSDMPQVAPLFGLDVDVDATAEEEASASTARRLRAAVLSALLGNHRWLIVFEDAHWLDDVSLLLVRDLRKAIPSLRILFAARTPAPEGLAKGHSNPVHVRIGPLDRDDVAALAASILGPFDPKHPFVDWLQARSLGNPMFARALIALLPPDIAETALKTPGAWRKSRAALEQGDLPATIEGAMLARFGSLPPSQMGLLKAASVIGGDFTIDALTALGTPSTLDQIESDLTALVGSGILVTRIQTGRAEWRFGDELTREVIYQSLPQQLLRELHRRAAEYETQSSARDPARVAHHWLEAGKPDRALAPLRQAGLQAKQAGAYAAAAGLWRTALDLLDSGKIDTSRQGKMRRAVLHRDLGLTSWRLGEPEQTIKHCYASLDGLWPGAPQSENGWKWMLVKQALGLSFQLVRPNWTRGKRKRKDRVEDWLRLNNGVRLIEAFYFSQGMLPAAAIATYGARIAEATGEVAYGARPYGFLGYLAGSRGWDRIARFCFERPRKDCLTKRDWPSLAQSINGETMYRLTQGQWARAIDRARFGRTLSRKISKGADTGSMTTLIGMGHLMAGDFAAMRQAFEDVEAIAYAKSNDHYLTFAREAMGQIELVAGSPAKAESLLVAALGLAKSVRDLQSALIAEGLLANTLVVLGRIDEAAAMLPGLIERAEATPMVNFGTWYGFGAAAEAATGVYAALGVGPAGAHRAMAIRASAILTKFARRYPVAVPRAELIAGQLQALNDDSAAAITSWQNGIRAAEAVTMRHDLARLHDAISRQPSASDDDRHQHAERARALAAECGVSTLPPLPLSIPTSQGQSA